MGDSRVEEARLADARVQIPAQVMAFEAYQQSLAQALSDATHLAGALRACSDHGLALWRAATDYVQRNPLKDDRPLYWARLQMLQQIRQAHFAFALDDGQRAQLLCALEDASRGRTSANFTQSHSKRILVTGFDPFGFAKPQGESTIIDLAVSNPSGAAVLELSNCVLLHQGQLAEVQSAIFPVRYEDFDLGVVERFFRNYFEHNRVDMVITISRGRKEFDLERFTGRRRSSLGRDNAGRSLADADPVSAIPLEAGAHLQGPEFLESTLPIDRCLVVPGSYKVNDNRRVTFLNGQSLNGQGDPESGEPTTLAELADKIAVTASGGGFLSNEISYRTHRLRDQLRSALPVGHLHVPMPDALPDTLPHPVPHVLSDPQANQARIVAQVKELVKAAIVGL